jgi:arsenate reductase-like glutaredoxin family protein
MSKNPNPTTVLHSLLQSSKSEKVRKQLLAIHQVCDEHHKQGESDFAAATIANICQAKGFMNAGTIYNKNSKVYRELINGWEKFADSTSADELSVLPANHPEVVLRKIFEKSMRSARNNTKKVFWTIVFRL